MRTNKSVFCVLLVSIVATTVVAAGCTTSNSPSGSSATSNTPAELPPIQAPAGANLSLSAIDVGQGDSLLLTFPHNESLLIDGGKEVEGPTVVAYLHAVGIMHLNGVIATHPDSDHIGGLITVLSSVQVDHVYDLGLPKSSSTYATFLQLIAQKNITYTKSRAGDSIAIDSDTAVFVEPIAAVNRNARTG